MSNITNKAAKIENLPLELVVPDANQPRSYFDEEKIKELAESIKQHGLLQPILVIPIENGRFQIVHGERRYRACKLLGLETIRTEIQELTDKEILEIQIVENLQREDLNPIEEAGAFQMMVDFLGYTHGEIAEKIGKSREYVTNKLRLLNLPNDLQRGVARRNFSEGHARAVLSINNIEKQREVCRQISINKLNVRETEQLIRRLKGNNVPRETSDNQTSEKAVRVASLKVWNLISPEDGEVRKRIPVHELITAYINDLRKLRMMG